MQFSDGHSMTNMESILRFVTPVMSSHAYIYSKEVIEAQLQAWSERDHEKAMGS
jgi:hypothetical protein